MNLLSVPYKSQITSGSFEHNNDCGAASSLMALNTYNVAMDRTVDQIYNQMQASGDVPVSAGQMQVVMSSYGLKTIWKAGYGLGNLYDVLSTVRPAILLVHYGDLVKAGYTQKTGFTGAHFLVVNGIDIVSVNMKDPYRDDGVENVEVPTKIFNSAWQNAHLDGNPDGGILFPILSIRDLSTPVPINLYTIKPGINGINVRSGPGQSFTFVKTLWQENPPIKFTVTKFQNSYAEVPEHGGWVYADYIVKTV